MNEFKRIVKEELIIAAKEYFLLLNSEIILKSNVFVISKKYTFHFDKSNFLHLTGVCTNLNAKDFFEKCLNKTINYDDFYYTKKKNKSTIKKKMKNLINIKSFFENKIEVQELFIKNKIFCKVATADQKCTIGFTGDFPYLYPNTLLDKNHLDPYKPIIKLKPIIKIHKKWSEQ